MGEYGGWVGKSNGRKNNLKDWPGRGGDKGIPPGMPRGKGPGASGGKKSLEIPGRQGDKGATLPKTEGNTHSADKAKKD